MQLGEDPNEKWVCLDTLGYDSDHYVSNLGRIISTKQSIKELSYVNNDGTSYVNTLKEDGVRTLVCIAKIVARVFIDNPNNYKYVRNLNGNKLDCSATNLEWCKFRGDSVITEEDLKFCLKYKNTKWNDIPEAEKKMSYKRYLTTRVSIKKHHKDMKLLQPYRLRKLTDKELHVLCTRLQNDLDTSLNQLAREFKVRYGHVASIFNGGTTFGKDHGYDFTARMEQNKRIFPNHYGSKKKEQ